VLLERLVATSAAVAAAPARSAKTAALAALLRQLAGDEIEPAVAWLSGEPRQGKVGVGWATVFSVNVGQAVLPSLTIADLDRSIDDVWRSSGPGSAAVRHAGLAELLGRATHEEAEFVRRLLTGELRQGALAGVMADAVAQASGLALAAVRRAAMLTGDLPGVARLALTEGQAGLDTVGLTLLHPVSPMLASPSAGVADAIEALGLSSVEWKLDGARIQAHRLGDDIKLFTRNGNDVTSRLPSVTEVVAGMAVGAVILDGEVLGADDDDRPGLFQDTMSSFSRRRRDDARANPLGVWFFDCLHVDGRDLIDEPLSARIAALEAVAGPWRVPAIVTEDVGAADLFLAGALAAGHEGVVIKSVGSRYEAGRRGQAWRKVKPVHTLDLVVLAAEWGHGRRRGRLSNLHLGARDPAGGWVMVGKTFKGLTDALLAWQTEALLARQSRVEGIAVFVRPELVVEVALDGVQISRRYQGGVALRFARVRRYRHDKLPEEADTIDAVRAMLTDSRRRG
jgi:DNA ligase 1